MTVIATIRSTPGKPVEDSLALVSKQIRTAFHGQVTIQPLPMQAVLLLDFHGPLTEGDVAARLSQIDGIAAFAEDGEVTSTPVCHSITGHR